MKGFMNEEHLPLSDGPTSPKALDERFADRPRVYQRLQEIADQMDRASAEGFTGDQAEEMTIEQVRKLGADILTDWARAESVRSVDDARAKHPEAINDGKKNSNGKRPSAP
jgi:hypothetical protein